MVSAPETMTGDGDSSRRLFGIIRQLQGSSGTADPPPDPESAGRTSAHTPAPPPLFLPDIPGYDLLDKIGRGGMGVVYQARDRELDKVVALKVVFPTGGDEAAVRARFEREVRALARIDHPNIVPVYHAGEGPGFPYFTMKYVPGGTLSRHMARIREDLPGAVRLVAKVARAVETLHAEGVLHRDLKPQNILLADGDEPLVADFGLAKFLGDDTEMTQSGAAIGTRQYMSPEQTRGAGREYGRACDIWSLGVILYEVLTGRRPFAAADPVELYRQIREDEPESCASTNPDVPADLDAVVQTCLTKEPDGRYPSAGAVADALEAWLAGAPVPRHRRRPRRMRWAAVAVGAAVLLAGGAAWVGWPDGRSMAERLAAGEEVELVGATGLPVVPTRPVPGSGGWLSTDRHGFLSVEAFGYGAVDLVTEPIPLPVRVVGEVAVRDRRGVGHWAGFYAGRRTWAALPADCHSQVQLVVKESDDRTPAGQAVVGERAQLGVYWWRVGGAMWFTNLAQSDRTREDILPENIHWHPLALTLTADGAYPEWGGKAFTALPADLARISIERSEPRDPAVPDPYPPSEPTYGPGIGLCVTSCGAIFRNVRLVPVPSDR